MMKELSLFMVIFLQVACVNVETLKQEAEEIVETDGFTLKLEAFVSRDFMPGNDDHSMNVVVELVETNQKAILESFDLKNLIVIKENDHWKSKFEDIRKEDFQKNVIQALANNGPEWEIGQSVDVICVFARTSDGKEFKIIVKAIKIEKTS